MKTLLGTIVTLGLASLMIAGSLEPPQIKPIFASAEQIKLEVQHERQAIQYRRASAAAAVVYRIHGCSGRYADATGEVAVNLGLSPRLLAAVVFVESTCRAAAVSGRDSLGLMQVNPRIWKHKRADLKDPIQSLRIGGRILKSYISRYGLVEGLHHYNGLGDSTNEYAYRVLAIAGMKG